MIAQAVSSHADFGNDFLQLFSREVSQDHAKMIMYAFLSTAKLSTRVYNAVNESIFPLFVSGKGNKGENLADVFSAFTDYYTHESAGGDDKMKQFVSSEFGNGATKKQEAMKFLIKCADVKAEFQRKVDLGRQLEKDYLASRD